MLNQFDMKLKSLVQLIIPIASTILLWLILWLLGIISGYIGHVNHIDTMKKIGEFLMVDISTFRNSWGGISGNTIFFWVLNITIIIIFEILITAALEEEEKEQ
jgi:hypothetical protein